VLFVRGVFSHVDRVEEALAELPKVEIHDAYLNDGRTACGSVLASNNVSCLAGWPGREALAAMDVVVLDDVPAPAFSLSQRRDLLDFVQGGGRLLVLGGWYSLSKGAWEGSFLEDALPVETVQATHLLRLKADDRRLAATGDFAAVLGGQLPASDSAQKPGGRHGGRPSSGENMSISSHSGGSGSVPTVFPRGASAEPDFGATGSVEWINHVRLREGAKVLMTAGTQPVLVAGDCG
jgi:hypothetical protein